MHSLSVRTVVLQHGALHKLPVIALTRRETTEMDDKLESGKICYRYQLLEFKACLQSKSFQALSHIGDNCHDFGCNLKKKKHFGDPRDSTFKETNNVDLSTVIEVLFLSNVC